MFLDACLADSEWTPTTLRGNQTGVAVVEIVRVTTVRVMQATTCCLWSSVVKNAHLSMFNIDKNASDVIDRTSFAGCAASRCSQDCLSLFGNL